MDDARRRHRSAPSRRPACLDARRPEALLLELLEHASAIAPTWRWERPDVTIMVSAIEVLPARSISTVSSAFMSSRQSQGDGPDILVLRRRPLRREGEAAKSFASSGESRFRFESSPATRQRGATLNDRAERAIRFQRLRADRSSPGSCAAARSKTASERGPCRKTQAGGGRSASAGARVSSMRKRASARRRGNAAALQGPARAVDDGDRHQLRRSRRQPRQRWKLARLSAPMIQTKSHARAAPLEVSAACRRCSGRRSRPRSRSRRCRGWRGERSRRRDALGEGGSPPSRPSAGCRGVTSHQIAVEAEALQRRAGSTMAVAPCGGLNEPP